MAAPSSSRSLTSAFKRLKLSPSSTLASRHQYRHVQSSTPNAAPAASNHTQTKRSNAALEQELASIRLPKAVQATYLAPLKREIPEDATKSAELQLRSYSVRNLEVFADFALRAAYFLNLPAEGPKPLKRHIQRWTLPRSNFVHKKSQETFERITMKRLIVIRGGNPETVALWLAFLRKHQYYGVGLKANVYEYGSVQTGKSLDAETKRIHNIMGDDKMAFETFASKNRMHKLEPVFKEPFKGRWGARAALGGAPSVGSGSKMLTLEEIKLAKDKALEARESVE